MSEVIWLRHPVFYNYEVSSDGRVRSLPHELLDSAGHHRKFPGKERKTYLSRSGYLTVGISNEGRRRTIPVHVLVCQAFHGLAPSSDHEVRHVDGTRTNNHSDNLVWGTRSENMQDALRHGMHNNARKTHCPYGHEYTRVSARGHRICRTCLNHQNRRWRAATYDTVCPVAAVPE